MTDTALPQGTWDTHVHIFDPAYFPYAESRSYSPGSATASNLADRHRAWGVDHAIVVQASVQGTDNSCLLDALRALGPSTHGVAVIDPETVTDEALADLASAQVVGLRVNLVSGGGTTTPEPLRLHAERLRGTGMFLQVYASLSRILDCERAIAEAGVPVVLDHFAGVAPGDDVAALSSLLRNAPVWVKLSADYRLGRGAEVQESWVPDLIRQFWSLIPNRLIWGSDWPHTAGGAARRARPAYMTEPFRKVCALSVPGLMADAGLNEAERAQIFARNPLDLMLLKKTNTNKGNAP